MTKEWSKQVFARNLQRYIAMSGKTQKELADAIGVSAPTFNEWISGKKFPRIDKIQKLADYFGILKSDLIEDKEKKPTVDDGLTDEQRKLIEFARSLSDDDAAFALQFLRTALEAMQQRREADRG